MQVSPQNLIYHELIGLEAEVIDSTNIAQIGIKGKVIDETKNTLKIEVDSNQVKILPKIHTHFIFTIPPLSGRRYLPDRPVRVKVDGSLLQSQPENRIQTKFKKSIQRRINI
jgi:ribonuclease P protein subunit POP4